MRAGGIAILLTILLAPVASAWAVDLETPIDPELSVRTSLLLSGAVNATATGAVYGAPIAERAGFGRGLTVEHCADRATETENNVAQQSGASDRCDEPLTGALVRVLAGGLIAMPGPGARVTLVAPAATAALGGANLTLNTFPAGPGLFVGGAARVDVEGTTFLVRGLGKNASIEVRADQGFRIYNGTAFTLRISGAEGAFLESTGLFVALGEDARVRVERAPTAVAEATLDVQDLHRLLRAIVTPDKLDRRADLATAFGPFQVVPVLLNGVVAGSRNVTLGGAVLDGFTLVRITDVALTPGEGNWTARGNATYAVISDAIVQRPGATPRMPVLLLALFAAGAFAARVATHRAWIPRRRRLATWGIRLTGAILLVLLASSQVEAVFGVDALAERSILSARSRTQLWLLVLGMAALAYASVGVATTSLAKSAFSSRKQSAALVPAALGVLAALLFLWSMSPALLNAVARAVRL
jgi:hypothetical protein